MKHRFTLTLMAILFNALLAIALPSSQKQGVKPKGQETSFAGSKIHFSDKSMAFGQKEMSEAREEAPFKAPETGANGEIRTPSGTPMDYLYSYSLMDAWGDSFIAGKPVKIYYDAEDNGVYIEKFLDEYMGDCYYVAGKLIEGDMENGTLEMETRKAVYYSWGDWLMLIVAQYDPNTGDFYVNDFEDTFKLYIKDGVITNDEVYIALASIINDTDVYWLQSNFRYDPIDLSSASIVEIPEEASLSHYYMTVNESDESIANIYNLGTEYYFNNIFEQGFTFKGTLNDDNKIHIELPQLVKADDEYVYLNTYEVVDNAYVPVSEASIVFDYDPSTGDISYYDGAPLALFSGNKYVYLKYLEPYQSIDFVKFTAEEEPIIVPGSATVKLYAMSTGYDAQGNHKGGLMKIGRQDNTIYFMRVDNTNYDVVMKGELDASSNKVKVALSQIVGIKGSTFLGLALAKQSIVVVEDYYAGDYNEIRYVEDKEAPEYIYIDYDPETETYTCNDVLAIIDAKRHSVSIALITPTYSPIQPVSTLPGDAISNEYVFSKDGDPNNSTVVKIMRSGDDFYFVHPAPNQQVEEMIIHGILNTEGKIEIEVPQLVAYGYKDQGVFMRVGNWERVYTPEDLDLQTRSWGCFYDDEVEAIYIDYDEGINEFNYDGYFSLVQFNDNRELVKATTPYYKTYVLGAFQPAAPTDLELIDKSEDYWGNGQRYRLDFVIPCLDIEGKYLPYDNISFRIYFDDEPFVFLAEDYPLTFTQDIIDVPFNHPASSEIPHPIWNSNMRQVYFYELPKEKIGVQSSYTYQNETLYSEISYLDIEQSSLDKINAESAVSIQIYDIYGRLTQAPHSGLYIVKKLYSDGSVVSEKIIID